MKKEELIRAYHEDVFNKNVQSLKVSQMQVDTLFGIIAERLTQGEEVYLPGIGKLVPVTMQPRRGTNPKTGEEIVIKAYRRIKLSLFGKFRNKLNGK